MRRLVNSTDRSVTARRSVHATLRKCARLSRQCGIEIAFYARDANGKWAVGYETTPPSERNTSTTARLREQTPLVYTDQDADWLQSAAWKNVRKRPRVTAERLVDVPEEDTNPTIFENSNQFSQVAERLAALLRSRLVRTTTIAETNGYTLEIMLDFSELGDNFEESARWLGSDKQLHTFLRTSLPSHNITSVSIDFNTHTVVVSVEIG